MEESKEGLPLYDWLNVETAADLGWAYLSICKLDKSKEAGSANKA